MKKPMENLGSQLGMTFIAFILLTGCFEEQGSIASIRGLVIDSADNPIENAHVLMTGITSDSVVTGVDGKFTFTNLKAGAWNMTVAKDGFLPYIVTISLEADENKVETVSLEKIFIKPSIKILNVKPAGGKQTIKVTSNVPWKIEPIKANWFSVSKDNGQPGEEFITISWDYSPYLTSRTDSIIFIGQRMHSSVIISQQQPYLTAYPTHILASASAGSDTIRVSANNPWIFLPLIPRSWVIYEILDFHENGKVKISWQANNTGYDRSAEYQVMGPETYIVPINIFQSK